MNNKNLNELDIKDLLKAIEGQDVSDVTSESFDDPVLSFIQAFNLVPGKNKVRDKLLHKLFRAWSNNKLIDLKNFNMQLGRYVPFDTIHHGYAVTHKYYKIDQNLLKISNETLKLINAKKRPATKVKSYKTHYEKFLTHYQIGPGDLYVEADILYHLYDKWIYKEKRRALSYDSFYDISKLYFDSKRISENKITWFGITDNIKQHISPEEVLRWREGRIKYGKGKKRKEIKEGYFKAYEPLVKNKEQSLYPEQTAKVKTTSPRSASKPKN